MFIHIIIIIFQNHMNLDTTIFDSVLAAAYGFHNYITDGYNLSQPILRQNVCNSREITPWTEGSKLMEYITKVNIDLYKGTFRNYFWGGGGRGEVGSLKKR